MQTKTVTTPIEELYAKALEKALIQFSDGRLQHAVAEKISVAFAARVDYENEALMHKSIQAIARDWILPKVKPEFFNAK